MTPKPKKLLSFLFALVSTFVLFAATPALAARPHEFSKTFGKLCQSASCIGEELKEPDGVAVNEASGDVYVVDRGANRVVRFSQAGAPEGEFTGPSVTGTGTFEAGASTITGVVKATGAFSVGEELSAIAAPGLEPGTEITAVESEGEALKLTISKAAKASEAPASLSTQQRFERPEAIAVDNSCFVRKLSPEQCGEQDPSNGDVYVADAAEVGRHQAIDKFSPTGEFIGQIREDGPEGQALEGVTVDKDGQVWAYQEDRTASRYSNAVANAFISSVTNEVVPSGFPRSSIAIDSAGNFYTVAGVAAEARVAEFGPTGMIISKELDKESSTAVSVEAGSDNPYICNTKTVALFEPDGTLLERLGEEGGAEHLTSCAGIGVDAATFSLFVSDAATGSVAVFGPAEASAPKVEGESFSSVTSDSATFAAEINPRSEPTEAATKYRFEYGRCATATRCSSSGYGLSAPQPEGLISPDFNVHGVSVDVTELQPGSTYHFRAVGTNGHGEGVPGPETTFTTEGAGGELALPDDRGWELVSPPEKQGARIEAIREANVIQAAASGDGITYLANAPTEAQPAGYSNEVQVLSRRGAAAWSSRDIAIPHNAATGFAIGVGNEYKFFDEELTDSAVQPFGQFIPGLSEEASESTAYLHHLGESCAPHCYHPLVSAKPGFANVPAGTEFGEAAKCIPKPGLPTNVVCGPEFVGASEDLAHVVLKSGPALFEGAGEGGLYEWSGGVLSQINLLPGGGGAAPTSGIGQATGGATNSQSARRAISTDGSRVIWSTPEALYLHEGSQTIQLDKAEEINGKLCKECRSGEGQYQIASTDGSRIFFTDQRRLSEGSGAQPGVNGKADLYECKIPSGGGACELSDITPERSGEGANVLGGVLGASEDGSYIYFAARGVQSEAANERGQKAVAGQPNLYVSHNGQVSFITTLSEGDSHDWEEVLTRQPTRVSGNGLHLALMSEASLSGYDNRDRESGKPVAEVYVYDAESERLSCASCDPSGVRPVGIEYRKLLPTEGALVGGPKNVWPESALVGANVPGWTSNGRTSRHQPRYLANSGRLFFDTPNALVPQDSNGTQDVYEYDPLGVKDAEGRVDCEESSATFSVVSGGCVSLISAGRSAQESAFLDASESGEDVFFLTSSKLSPLDTDTAFDVYDAHVCRADSPCIEFPTTQSPPCTTEASCKATPTPQPSVFGTPPSATFEGLGNPGAAAPAVVKAKAKPKTRAQKLSKALKACQKRPKSKRAACKRQAQKRYGPLQKAKRKRRR